MVKMNKETKINLFRFETKLVILTVFFLFILRLFANANFFTKLVISLYDLVIFSIILLFYLLSFRKYPLLSKIFFYFFYFLTFILASVSARSINYAVERKFSLFSFKLGMLTFYLQNIINFKVLFGFVGLIVLIFVSAYYLPLKRKYVSEEKERFVLYGLLFFVALSVLIPTIVSSNNFDNIYVNTVSSFVQHKEKVELKEVSFDGNLFDKKGFIKGKPKYDKILLFVFETVPMDDYSIENKRGFFNNIKDHSIFYTNYYTNNQDSRTAVFTMLSSWFIPYESYSYSDWTSKYYFKTIERPSLVDYFNDLNYNTDYVISSVDLVYVGKGFNWKNTHTIPEDVFYKTKENKEYYCNDDMTYQRGCEDDIMLKEVKKIIDQNKVFLLQEFVYGHITKYMENVGKTRAQYYNDYLQKVYDYIKEKGYEDKTLIILVSDHGKKYRSIQLKKEGYHIPLIFYNKNLEPKKIDALASHLDFKDILLNILYGNVYIPKNDFVFFVGTTGSGLVGFVDKKGEFGIYDDVSYSLLSSSKKLTKKKINFYYNLFNSYRVYFEGLPYKGE